MKNKIKIYHPALGYGELGEGIAHLGIFEYEIANVSGVNKLEKNLRVYLTGGKSFVFGKEACPIGEVYSEKKPISLGLNSREEDKSQLEIYCVAKKCILKPQEDIYDYISEKLDRCVEFYNPSDRDVLVVWIIGTYFFRIFQAFPYLIISGSRGSGKTKLLDFLDCVAFSTVKMANTSVSALFRIVDSNRCTLLIDEAESLRNSDESRDLGKILNVGYKSDANVLRTNLDTFSAEEFNTYSPKAIASINRVDRTLGSRGIAINMIKTSDKKKGNFVIRRDEDTWSILRDRLRVMYLDLAVKVDDIYRNDEEINQLACRKNELWSPLLAISKVISNDVFEKLKKIALGVAEDDEALIEEWDAHLLLGLKGLVVNGGGQFMVSLIKDQMTNRMEGDQAFKVTSRWVGEALRRFGFSKFIRTNNGYKYSINREKLDDLLFRYQIGDRPLIDEHSERRELDSAKDDYAEMAESIFNDRNNS